jgi:hypothetical protein
LWTQRRDYDGRPPGRPSIGEDTMQAPSLALSLVLAATPALAAHCPHGQLWRVRMARCVSLSSPAALAYEGPTHWMRQRIQVDPPADLEPLKPGDISLTLPDPDPAIVDIPLTDPDPAAMALKQQLDKKP